MTRSVDRGEAGAMAPLLACLLFVALTVMALATEVALLHSRFVAVAGIADAAAEAGAAQVDESALHDGRLAVDVVRARAGAERYVSVAEPDAGLVVEARPDEVCVEVDVVHRVEILAIVGIGEFEVRAGACAVPSTG